jgi:hypothetical protein
MSILVVGSVAFDTIATPSGRVNDILGGAATYFSLAASYFTEVRMVAVVGDDFKPEHEAVLKKRGVDTRGIERTEGKTFRWGGQYLDNLNEAKTDFTELNVFEKFQPRIPKEYADTQFLVPREHPSLAANGGAPGDGWRPPDGRRHHEFLDQGHAQGIGGNVEAGQRSADQRHRDQNAGQRKNLLRAAQKVIAMGPSALVVKHGEYGATIFFREGAFGIGSHPFRAPACRLTR